MWWILSWYVALSALISAAMLIALIDPPRVPWLKIDISRRHPKVHALLALLDGPDMLLLAWIFFILTWPIAMLDPRVQIRLKRS